MTITNTNVNSGNPILIMANRQWQCTMNVKLNKEEEVYNTSTNKWDIVEIDTEAITNPTYSIYGLIDIDTTTTSVTINSISTTLMTEQMVKQLFVQRGESCYLHIRVGDTPYFISEFDGTTVTEIAGGDATGGIKCVIKDVQIWGSVNHKNIATGGQGSKVTYQITLVEDK